MPILKARDNETKQIVKFEWHMEEKPTQDDMEEIFEAHRKRSAGKAALKDNEQPQPKIGALKSPLAADFDDKPDFMGEAVGVPRHGARIAEKIGKASVYPMTKALESQEVFTGEDPFSFGQKQASILDMSGHAFRGALRQGGASETLIDDITEEENFGDTAEAFGRFAVQFAGETAFIGGAAKLLGGIGSSRFFTKTVDDIKKGITADVRKTFEKAVRPRGSKDLRLKEKYYNKATDSSIDIIKNKNDITLTKKGVDVKGELPETLGHVEQANLQRRQSIADEFAGISTRAEQLEFQGNVDGLIKDLELFIEKPSHRHGTPEMVNYAKQTLDDLKSARANGEITPKYMEEMIQIKNQNLRQRMNTPDPKIYQSAAVDELYNYEMNKILETTINKMGSGEGSKYRELRRLWGAHKQVSKDVSDAATRLAHSLPNSITKLTETFTGYHFLRGVASKNPATIFAAGASKGINAIEAFLQKPNRKITKMFKRTETAVTKMDAITPIIEKAKAPLKPSPKQIGWDGTYTRSGTGKTIHLGPEEYVPPGLQRAKIGGATSPTPKKLKSAESKITVDVESDRLLPSQMSRSRGVSEAEFRSELISEQMRASNIPKKSATIKVNAIIHKAEQKIPDAVKDLLPSQQVRGTGLTAEEFRHQIIMDEMRASQGKKRLGIRKKVGAKKQGVKRQVTTKSYHPDERDVKMIQPFFIGKDGRLKATKGKF